MTIISGKPTCPYCKNQLENALKRKTKCPHCGLLIYVRKGELVTEDDAQKIDWLVYLDQFGITEQKFEKSRDELSKNSR